jgi:murein DD-endopeptidase MepM/ murein hydrolase activator NlpD
MNTKRFAIVSWVLTVAIAGSLIGGALWWRKAHDASALPQPQATVAPENNAGTIALPLPLPSSPDRSIGRNLQLNTNSSTDAHTYEPQHYIVQGGDSLSAIAKKFNITIETILYNNDQLNDDAHSLKAGMTLLIPPVDGLYYTWQDGDTIDNVAANYKAEADAIVEFPANDIDLTAPDDIKPGTSIMIPGGSRKLRDLTPPIPPGAKCGGTVGTGSFVWPVSGEPHTLSGNTFSGGHPGVDMTAVEGDVVLAADSGTVIFAGWSEYGYGNMIEIDHCNGYVTLYAHLNAIFVSVGQSVGQGQQIGTAGNTGNSFGAHLHFEIRLGGSAVNPLDYLF